MIQNEDFRLASVTFRCRQCGGIYRIGCSPMATGFEIIQLMGKALMQACRHCDAPGRMNYVLESVNLSTRECELYSDSVKDR